ncbi:hypothetical protein HII36_13805 [Nonomuraea sp. NN258]|uniref:hypothetical protein n=1 Tax=Nonomuraea antri TaxID=2730852 RepID=UPI0015682164|nr:hypothetical protein [Nonomuraea antri]NRQ32908.1 hypothetical protein [Nonomuraea antri]
MPGEGRVTARRINDHVEVLHTGDENTVLEVSRHDWERFTTAVKAGVFDLETLNREAQAEAQAAAKA